MIIKKQWTVYLPTKYLAFCYNRNQSFKLSAMTKRPKGLLIRNDDIRFLNKLTEPKTLCQRHPKKWNPQVSTLGPKSWSPQKRRNWPVLFTSLKHSEPMKRVHLNDVPQLCGVTLSSSWNRQLLYRLRFKK